MTTDAKNKADEIALMLVMTSEGDAMGIELLLDLCHEFSQAAGENTRIKQSLELITQNKSNPSILSLIKSFAEAAAQFAEGSDQASFPIALSLNDQDSDQDEYSNIDKTFLAEYIETHALMLEEFESSTLQFTSGQIGLEDLVVGAKRYLHNLKGDSGSIGLNGMERVCHHLEDILVSVGEADIAALLLSFKQWAILYLEALAEGKRAAVTAGEFLENCPKAPAPLKPSPDQKPQEPPVAQAPHPATESPSSDRYTLTGEKDILLEFAGEAEEHLSNVESVILEAEGNYSKDAIDTIFRGVHSIKGGSAYFGIEEMTKCSHILENYLSEVRDGRRTLDAELSGFLLTYIDLQKNVLVRAKKAACSDSIMVRSQQSIDFLTNLGTYGRSPGEAPARLVNSTPTVSSSEDSPTANPSKDPNEKLALKTYVKVDTTRLDLLIDSIGEMVIYSSMLIRHCRELLKHNESVMDATHRVEKFSRDLQDIGMSMRLIPIKGLFQKMSRLVWDVSRKLGKDVVFSTEGEDTELDRNLIDKLADPLMHMVRNSLDHGIESPEEREKLGKPRTGTVKLSAYHAGGSIHIKIEDDGRGLDPDKLLKKALEKGIITENQSLSRGEIYQLIFAAGFSTAASVTDISGRGVGMDVVRRNVENLRGRILIDSEVNKGSTFTIEIPLTLAILDGMQIRVGSETFVIPNLSIVEFVQPKLGTIFHSLDRGETLNLRGKYLPIYRMASLFGISGGQTDPYSSTMVIVESNHEMAALMVDDILGQCSTVIKGLGGIFKDMQGITGCAIMPSGNIALILDILSLMNLAKHEYRYEHTQGESRSLEENATIPGE